MKIINQTKKVMTRKTKTTDEATIRKLVEKWAGAARAKNLEGVLAHHSQDILMFDVPPPLQSKGIEAYKKTWDLFFGWAQDAGIFDIEEMIITAGKEVAFVAAIMRCAGFDDRKKKIHLQFRLTIGLRKIHHEWTIVHEHHSLPAS
jgi:ketosteroid isomerase-like protein